MAISDNVKKKLEQSLVVFRNVVLSNDEENELEPAYFHHDLSDLLLNNTNNIAIEMFRESGKSSYALRTYPLHCLCYPTQKNSYIVLIKQNQRTASAKLKDLINEYMSNPMLQHNLVKIREQSMNCFSVDVKDRTGKVINIRIEAYGKGAGIRGLSNQDRRPSIIILDDVQDKDDSRSETVVETDWDWFLSDVVFLGKLSRIFMIGNNLGERCIIERCINNAKNLNFDAIKIPVIIDGKSTWAEKQSLKEIEKEKKDYIAMGKLDIWLAEKMCLAVNDETRVFKQEDFRYYSFNFRQEILKKSNLYACLDPASSTNKTACYRAITVTGVDAESQWYLMDCLYGRWDSAEMIDIIFNVVIEYGLRDFYVEKGWWVQIMESFLTAEMKKRNIFFNVIPLEHAKAGSKLERIKLLQPRFKAHTVMFPDRNAPWLDEFKTELSGVTKDDIKSEYIDCVDAFAMTEQVAVPPIGRGEGYKQGGRPQKNTTKSLFSISGF